MIEGAIMRYAGGVMLALLLAFLTGCSPVYLWETPTTSTPRPHFFDVAVLAGEPVATLGPLTPAGLHGLSFFLSAVSLQQFRKRSLPCEQFPTTRP
jgi:hypothetical protein